VLAQPLVEFADLGFPGGLPGGCRFIASGPCPPPWPLTVDPYILQRGLLGLGCPGSGRCPCVLSSLSTPTAATGTKSNGNKGGCVGWPDPSASKLHPQPSVRPTCTGQAFFGSPPRLLNACSSLPESFHLAVFIYLADSKFHRSCLEEDIPWARVSKALRLGPYKTSGSVDVLDNEYE
jgi:hypothetical protein